MSDGSDHPISGQAMLVAGAKASVPLKDLPSLVEQAAADLRERGDEYRRAFECVHETPDYAVFLVPADHWDAVGDRLGFDARERDAVRRAHEEQARRVASEADRREEFESAFEIRAAAVVGTGGHGGADERERGGADGNGNENGRTNESASADADADDPVG